MEYESEFDEDRQRCILLLDYIASSMSNDVKLKIALQGYTPLEIATIYIIDHIKYFDVNQGRSTQKMLWIHMNASTSFLFLISTATK